MSTYQDSSNVAMRRRKRSGQVQPIHLDHPLFLPA
jgi:hypothetical protein